MKKIGLTGNQLKIIGLAAMTIDHIGLIFLPQYVILRIIGRLAFPIFAYMIAEGCRYTKNMYRYFGLMAGCAVACQVVGYLTTGSLCQCVLVTFSLAVALIAILRNAAKKRTPAAWLAAAGAMAAVFFLARILPELLPGTDYKIDYGFWGVLLPVLLYFCKTKWGKLGMAAAVLLLVSYEIGSVQMFSLLTLPLLALYNGQRGKLRMKYLFYIYYPAHLAALYLLTSFLYA